MPSGDLVVRDCHCCLSNTLGTLLGKKRFPLGLLFWYLFGSPLQFFSNTVSIAIMMRSTGLVTHLERRGKEVLGYSSDIARFACCPVPPSGCAMSSRLDSKLWLGGSRPWYGGGSGIVFIFTSYPSWRGWTLLGTDCGFWCRGNYGVIWLRRFWRATSNKVSNVLPAWFAFEIRSSGKLRIKPDVELWAD